MNLNFTREVLKDKETYLVYGNADPFINDERIAEVKTLTNQLNISHEIKVFEGKHDIDSQTLLTFL